MPEAVGDQDAPVPAGARIRLRVGLSEDHRRLDVSLLVVDPELDLEIGPIPGKLVDDTREALGEGGHPRRVKEGPI